MIWVTAVGAQKQSRRFQGLQDTVLSLMFPLQKQTLCKMILYRGSRYSNFRQ